MKRTATRNLTVASLFAGIGGFDLGLEQAGHRTVFRCEIDPVAREVLEARFPGVDSHDDITTLKSIPDVDLVAAGFPCQDLSLAGTQRGLAGARSGLISDVLRLIRNHPPEFVLLENVLYFVKRQKGALLLSVTSELEKLGYRWAYRVVDSRGFGLPQRRQRVIILASAGDVDPSTVLLSKQVATDLDDRIMPVLEDGAYGFYWTEGKRAVGWAPGAVPTIKGGSGLSIPSPPAIYDSKTGLTGTPSVEDGERLQGFDSGWTDVKYEGNRIKPGKRWSLVGNAVSVPLARWVGEELARERERVNPVANELVSGRPMPFAAWNTEGTLVGTASSLHVETARHSPISNFLTDPLKPLSTRAIKGFLSRAHAGVMALPEGFLDALAKQALSQR
jgi:DNA (cytosine-5)-methyltransferase 1